MGQLLVVFKRYRTCSVNYSWNDKLNFSNDTCRNRTNSMCGCINILLLAKASHIRGMRNMWKCTYVVCHYENTPIQIHWKFYHQKMTNFQIKYSDIFHISAKNIHCGYSLEPPRRGGSNEYPQSMFLSRNNINNVYPCKPQFYYIKVGFKEVNIGVFSWCVKAKTQCGPRII